MEQLPQAHYAFALEQLEQIPFNTLFAASVLKGHAKGLVYTDNLDTPRVFYVIHECGMSLLFGDLSDSFLMGPFSDYIRNNTKQRVKKEWMQIFPLSYEGQINQLLSQVIANEHLHFSQRINFEFDSNCYQRSRPLASGLTLSPLSHETYEKFGSVVVPRAFWSSYESFKLSGVGFELKEEGAVIAIAFSALASPSQLELGMEVHPEKRKQGYGSLVTSALIDHCLELNLTPLWSCNSSNHPSFQLAQKLGFKPTLRLPYYEIPLVE